MWFLECVCRDDPKGECSWTSGIMQKETELEEVIDYSKNCLVDWSVVGWPAQIVLFVHVRDVPCLCWKPDTGNVVKVWEELPMTVELRMSSVLSKWKNSHYYGIRYDHENTSSVALTEPHYITLHYVTLGIFLFFPLWKSASSNPSPFVGIIHKCMFFFSFLLMSNLWRQESTDF